MTWILVFIMAGPLAGITGNVAFSSKEKCEIAKQALLKTDLASNTFVECFKY